MMYKWYTTQLKIDIDNPWAEIRESANREIIRELLKNSVLSVGIEKGLPVPDTPGLAWIKHSDIHTLKPKQNLKRYSKSKP